MIRQAKPWPVTRPITNWAYCADLCLRLLLTSRWISILRRVRHHRTHLHGIPRFLPQPFAQGYNLAFTEDALEQDAAPAGIVNRNDGRKLRNVGILRVRTDVNDLIAVDVSSQKVIQASMPLGAGVKHRQTPRSTIPHYLSSEGWPGQGWKAGGMGGGYASNYPSFMPSFHSSMDPMLHHYDSPMLSQCRTATSRSHFGTYPSVAGFSTRGIAEFYC